VPPSAFREYQLTYPRVKLAYARKWPQLQALLRSRSINPDRLEVFFRVFKVGRRLEAWGRNQGEPSFRLLRSYWLAGTSGSLGPKRTEGDNQVPEGFYHLDRFNPISTYYMSLGLDYPNASDRALGGPNPGSHIFVHGSDVTVGCLPITDECIQEVYLLALEARSAGQQELQIHIFPFEMTDQNMEPYRKHKHYAFWKSLQPGFAYFDEHLTPAVVEVLPTGFYAVK
jgi:murein L,D-transpeptidase YafK